MRTRDWAGTVLVTCLIALASQLSSHRILVGLLFGAASMSGVLIGGDARAIKPGGHGSERDQ